MRRSRLVFASVLAIVCVAVPLVSAQSTAQQPVLLKALSDESVATPLGQDVVLEYSLLNLNARTAFFVSVTGLGLDGWSVSASPDEFFLEPRATANVTVTLASTGERPTEETRGHVVFNLVNSDTGAVIAVERDVAIRVTDSALVLGFFENPLPPPLDNNYGVFVLNIGFWAVVGVASFLAGDTVVRYLTRFARVEVTRVVIQKLRWPVFWFVLALGVKQSVDVLPRDVLSVFAARTVVTLAAGAFGLYAAYRAFDAFLFYYTAEVAPRTRSRVDDLLMPAIRKLTVFALFVVGIGFALSVFGFNPGVIFGAAGIMGLAIAFAAQETISNFLSGVFILLDRPFAEGEDIMLETGEVTRVEKIGLRSTRLYHYKNHELIVLPNNQLATRRIINLTNPDQKYKVNLEFGVSYGTDVAKLREVATRVAKDTPGVFMGDDIIVLFTAFADSSLNFVLRYTVEDYRQRFAVTSDMRERLLDALRAEGIEIPFPQRVLHVAPGKDGSRTISVESRASAKTETP